MPLSRVCVLNAYLPCIISLTFARVIHHDITTMSTIYEAPRCDVTAVRPSHMMEGRLRGICGNAWNRPNRVQHWFRFSNLHVRNSCRAAMLAVMTDIRSRWRIRRHISVHSGSSRPAGER